jgi:hypothetical protein
MIPYHLMRHKIEHYATTFEKVAGEQVASYSHVQDIRANVQQPSSELLQAYNQRDIRLAQVAYLVDKDDFDLVSIEDRIVFNEVAYQVVAKKNLANLDRIFQIDLQEEK